jgi:hypothetical protein
MARETEVLGENLPRCHNNDDAPGPTKRLRITTQKKQSDWNWTKTDNNPVIYPLISDSGVCEHLLNKFEPDPPSELFDIFGIYGTFVQQNFGRNMNNPDRKKLKMMINGLTRRQMRLEPILLWLF